MDVLTYNGTPKHRFMLEELHREYNYRNPSFTINVKPSKIDFKPFSYNNKVRITQREELNYDGKYQNEEFNTSIGFHKPFEIKKRVIQPKIIYGADPSSINNAYSIIEAMKYKQQQEAFDLTGLNNNNIEFSRRGDMFKNIQAPRNVYINTAFQQPKPKEPSKFTIPEKQVEKSSLTYGGYKPLFLNTLSAGAERGKDTQNLPSSFEPSTPRYSGTTTPQSPTTPEYKKMAKEFKGKYNDTQLSAIINTFEKKENPQFKDSLLSSSGVEIQDWRRIKALGSANQQRMIMEINKPSSSKSV